MSEGKVASPPQLPPPPVHNMGINVNNVVCSYATKCHLNLRRIAMEGMHVEYKKENNMVNMRLRKPLATATIWSSGKITCTGATSETDAYKAARRFCRLLQKMKFKVRMSNYRVVNVLATCSLGFDIDLNRIADTYRKECSYEPELHPGATFKVKDLRATLKLFTTGSITLTAPSVSAVHKAIDFIYPILCEYRRKELKTLPPQPLPVVVVVPDYQTPAAPANTFTPIISNTNNSTTSSTTTSSSSGGSYSSASPYESIYHFNGNFSFASNYTQSLQASSLSGSSSTTSSYSSSNSIPSFTSNLSHCFNDNLLIDSVFDDFLQ